MDREQNQGQQGDISEILTRIVETNERIAVKTVSKVEQTLYNISKEETKHSKESFQGLECVLRQNVINMLEEIQGDLMDTKEDILQSLEVIDTNQKNEKKKHILGKYYAFIPMDGQPHEVKYGSILQKAIIEDVNEEVLIEILDSIYESAIFWENPDLLNMNAVHLCWCLPNREGLCEILKTKINDSTFMKIKKEFWSHEKYINIMRRICTLEFLEIKSSNCALKHRNYLTELYNCHPSIMSRIIIRLVEGQLRADAKQLMYINSLPREWLPKLMMLDDTIESHAKFLLEAFDDETITTDVWNMLVHSVRSDVHEWNDDTTFSEVWKWLKRWLPLSIACYKSQSKIIWEAFVSRVDKSMVARFMSICPVSASTINFYIRNKYIHFDPEKTSSDKICTIHDKSLTSLLGSEFVGGCLNFGVTEGQASWSWEIVDDQERENGIYFGLTTWPVNSWKRRSTSTNTYSVSNFGGSIRWKGVKQPDRDIGMLKRGDIVIFNLDMDSGTCSLKVNHEFHGIVFEGLCGLTVYPCVGLGWKNQKVSLLDFSIGLRN